jgi:hypothetical protein
VVGQKRKIFSSEEIMATYAYCHRCRIHHKRGAKIFTDHKESLGMYTEKLPKTSSYSREYRRMRNRGEL